MQVLNSQLVIRFFKQTDSQARVESPPPLSPRRKRRYRITTPVVLHLTSLMTPMTLG